MTSHGFADLLTALGVERSYSRPRVSDDNAFSVPRSNQPPGEAAGHALGRHRLECAALARWQQPTGIDKSSFGQCKERLHERFTVLGFCQASDLVCPAVRYTQRTEGLDRLDDHSSRIGEREGASASTRPTRRGFTSTASRESHRRASESTERDAMVSPSRRSFSSLRKIRVNPLARLSSGTHGGGLLASVPCCTQRRHFAGGWTGHARSGAADTVQPDFLRPADAVHVARDALGPDPGRC